jgi:hypothetical protein
VFAGDLPSLAAFPPADKTAKQFVRLDVARCPKCEQSRFLTASAVQIKIDKKGKENVTEKRLITNAMLTPSQFAVVEACAKLCRNESLAALANEQAPQSDDSLPAAIEEAVRDT